MDPRNNIWRQIVLINSESKVSLLIWDCVWLHQSYYIGLRCLSSLQSKSLILIKVLTLINWSVLTIKSTQRDETKWFARLWVDNTSYFNFLERTNRKLGNSYIALSRYSLRSYKLTVKLWRWAPDLGWIWNESWD